MPIARVARRIAVALCLVALCLGSLLAAAPALAEHRVALVIGNAAYAHGGRLANPAKDATVVAEALRRVGFSVILQNDLGRDELEAALKSFTRASAGADVALVYYAGHGIEKGGTNYLIPVDATLAADSDIDFEAVPLDLVMHSVTGATRLKVVILDACRNNPFRDSMKRSAGVRGIGQGLAKPPDPEEGDMLVAYAAEAGSTAEDGSGANSPFATALAAHLPEPGVDIRIMFGRIRDDVRSATAKRQEPAVYESLGGEQFFMAPAITATSGAVQVAGGPPDARMMDLTYWQSVQASNDPVQLKSYLDQYPDGAFAALAKAKIAALQAAAPTALASSAGATPSVRSQAVGVQAAATAASAGDGGPTAARPMARAGGGMGLMRPRRFNGFWRVAQTCPNPENPANPLKPQAFVVEIRGGRVHGARGVADQPGWMALDGNIGPAGMATLDAHGVTAATPMNGMRAGMPYDNVVTARFSDNAGAGQWEARRVCHFSFARVDAGELTPRP